MSSSSQQGMLFLGGDFRLTPASYWLALHAKFDNRSIACDANCGVDSFARDELSANSHEISRRAEESSYQQDALPETMCDHAVPHVEELFEQGAVPETVNDHVALTDGEVSEQQDALLEIDHSVPRSSEVSEQDALPEKVDDLSLSRVEEVSEQQDAVPQAVHDLAVPIADEVSEQQKAMPSKASGISGQIDPPEIDVATHAGESEAAAYSSASSSNGKSKLRLTSTQNDDLASYGWVDSEDMNPSKSGTFTIRLKKKHDSILGVQVAFHGHGSPLVIENVCDGILQAWNDCHPDEQIKRGDWILEVNGVSDPEKLIDECQKSGILDIQFFRPSHTQEFPDFQFDEQCSSSASSSSSSWQGMQSDFDRSYSHSATSSSGSSSSSATMYSASSSQSSSTPSQSSRKTRKKMSDKVGFGLGYVKERVESKLPVTAQVSVKAHKGLEYVKVCASAASGAMSAQISQTAQKGLKLAKAFGKAGGA